MNISEKMFEYFSLNSLGQKEDLDKVKVKVINANDFLRCDLSILSEREIVTTLINGEVFSEDEKKLIRVWAAILKSKKLFEIVEGSNLTDIEFVANLEKVCKSSRFIELVSSINWKYVNIDTNDVCVAGIEGFYEEIAITMARNESLTLEFLGKLDLKGVDWNYEDVNGENILKGLCDGRPDMNLLVCLVNKEIDINIQNIDKETAFMSLCRNEYITLDMVELFFDNKVDINVQAYWGHTAFMVLCENRFVTFDMIKLFFDKGVDINLQNVNGTTAFMGLCGNESVTLDMVKLFFENGVDLSIRNRAGLSSLDFYIRCGGQNEEILKFLSQN